MKNKFFFVKIYKIYEIIIKFHFFFSDSGNFNLDLKFDVFSSRGARGKFTPYDKVGGAEGAGSAGCKCFVYSWAKSFSSRTGKAFDNTGDSCDDLSKSYGADYASLEVSKSPD